MVLVESDMPLKSCTETYVPGFFRMFSTMEEKFVNMQLLFSRSLQPAVRNWSRLFDCTLRLQRHLSNADVLDISGLAMVFYRCEIVVCAGEVLCYLVWWFLPAVVMDCI